MHKASCVRQSTRRSESYLRRHCCCRNARKSQRVHLLPEALDAAKPIAPHVRQQPFRGGQRVGLPLQAEALSAAATRVENAARPVRAPEVHTCQREHVLEDWSRVPSSAEVLPLSRLPIRPHAARARFHLARRTVAEKVPSGVVHGRGQGRDGGGRCSPRGYGGANKRKRESCPRANRCAELSNA